MSIEEQIRIIVARISGRNKSIITPEMNLEEDLDVDTYSKAEIIEDIEDAFFMDVTEDQIEKIETIQDLFDLVNSDMDKISS